MKKLFFLWCCIFLFFFFGCTNSLPHSSGNVAIYMCHLTDCDEVFIKFISSSNSVSCAFYDIDNDKIIHLLNEKNASVVVDEHQKEKYSFSKRFGNGLMHNKFCVINNSLVITGSYNPSTFNSFDNVVVVNSVPLADHFNEQFSQLLSNKKRPSSHTMFIHNNKLLEAYACPQDDCANQIYRHIQHANESIFFSLFTFTDKKLSRLLIEKHKDGVLVSGVVESFQSHMYNQFYVLEKSGLPVFLETSSTLQHNKVFVIDDSIVITGSFNPTIAANTINDENIIIFHDSLVAGHYKALVEDTIKRTQSFKYGSRLS